MKAATLGWDTTYISSSGAHIQASGDALRVAPECASLSAKRDSANRDGTSKRQADVERTIADKGLLKKPLGYRFVKRAFDIVSSGCGLIVLCPVFLATTVAIKLDDPGPALFIQDRNGLDDKVFRMYKFRSMCVDAPKMRSQMEALNEIEGGVIFKMRDDPRVTKVGRFIRRTSIDELPQLLNILKGDMSVVGPRPLATYETERIPAELRKRTMVKPGLIGYWQIWGHRDTSFEEMIRLDFQYIEEASILTDARVFLAATAMLLLHKGAK